MPRGDLVRQRLKAHIGAGGVVLGEGAGVHGVLVGVEAMLSPMSEGATVALATGLALAGKAVIVEIVDPAGLLRAADALVDLAGLQSRSDGAFSPTVIIRVPGGTDTRGVGVPVYIASRESDAAEQIDAALAQRGVVVLVDDSYPDAPEGLAPAALGAPVTLLTGDAVTVLASGSNVQSALDGARLSGVDAAVIEVRGPGRLALGTSGHVVAIGEIAGLTATLHDAFWSLEAPWVSLPAGAGPEAVSAAIHTVLGA